MTQASIFLRLDGFSQDHEIVSYVRNPCGPGLVETGRVMVVVATFVELTFLEALPNSPETLF